MTIKARLATCSTCHSYIDREVGKIEQIWDCVLTDYRVKFTALLNIAMYSRNSFEF